ncbi:MAG TPA: hypothetical protein VH951_06095, partial [Dehalococcoidia bacterium]
LWGIHHHGPSVAHTRAALAQTPHKADVFEVRSARELERLVERLTAESRGSAGAGVEASTTA